MKRNVIETVVIGLVSKGCAPPPNLLLHQAAALEATNENRLRKTRTWARTISSQFGALEEERALKTMFTQTK